MATTHTLDAARSCTVCGVLLSRQAEQWLRNCPGVPWYAWERIPAELATRTALAREGLRPAALDAPAGYYVAWTRRTPVLLYDRRQAIPKRAARSDREREARAAGARRLLAARTCTQCGHVARSARRLFTPPGDDPDPVLHVAPDSLAHLCEGCADAWEYRAELRKLYRTAAAILADGAGGLNALDLGGERMAADAPLRILDTETTGLDWDAEPIELAIVDGWTGAVLLDTRLRPTAPITEGAYAVHGISAADLREAPTLADVWPRVRELLRGALVIAYNADFDRRILAQGAERYTLRALAGVRWYCLMEACTVLDAPVDGRWLSLAAVCAELDVTRGAEIGPAHGARADALATLAVLRTLAARADTPGDSGPARRPEREAAELHAGGALQRDTGASSTP